jgi:hypothetical protein
MKRGARLRLAVAAVSAAVIAFQLVVMQLLAVAQWHHFAYMVISMALLGFGAAGTLVVLGRDRLLRRYAALLPALCAATAVTMAASVWVVERIGGFDAFLLFFDASQIVRLVAVYLVYALSFLLAGVALTLVFDREVERIGTLYGASLGGSAAGAIGGIALLWWLPPAQLAGVLALLPLLAAWWLRPPMLPARTTAAIAFATLVLPVCAILWPTVPQPSQYKPISAALLLPDARVIHRAFSPHGQLEVVRAPALRYAPGTSLRDVNDAPVRDVVFVDGQTFGTLLGRAEADAGHVLDRAPQGLAYAVRRPVAVLVLDAATGTDVSHALAHGAARATAVEPNLQALRLLRDEHPEWIDGLYRDSAVRLFGTTARAYLGHDDGQRFDLVVLPTLGSFGGGAGVGALHERYELTLEAFDAIWRRLADGGLITLTLWDDQPPRLVLRTLATLRALLARQGIGDATAHIAAVRGWGTTSFVIGPRAWSTAEVQRMRRFAAERGFDPLLLPGVAAVERDRFNRVADRGWFDAVDTLVAGDAAALIERYPFDLRPTRDDRPFFEHFMAAAGLRELLKTHGARELPYLELGYVFALASFVQIVVIASLLILLPLLRLGWAGTRRRWTLLYFAGTGTGFMLFEMVMMQELVLVLGDPVHAAAATLAALLVGAGLGSLASTRLPATPQAVVGCGLTIVVLIVLYALWLTPALGPVVAWPLAAKAMAVLLLLAPPAFVMGMMFPLGLRRLAGSDRTHIAWACGIDHSVSVAASAGAMLLALEAGFGAVMLAAAAAYVAVAFAGSRLGSGVSA